MKKQPTQRSCEELLDENKLLYDEVLVARRASELTAELVVKQFMRMEGLLRQLEEKVATEQKLQQSLSEKLQEAAEREQKLAEARAAAEDANQAKSLFLANMSHELRTPLNAIIGYSEMLIEDAEDLEQPDFIPDLEKIRHSGKHLLSVINEILDLSKVEAGKMELSVERFDVWPLVEEIANTVRPLVEENGNSLELLCDAAPGIMLTDLMKVKQILLNLLGNACKFTENGQISLEVHREQIGDPLQDWLVFRVRDTGIGMSAGQIAKVFNAFTQADLTTSRKFGGTGLGLAISKKFCDMMGGELSVESEERQGTTFTVKLPADGVTEPLFSETHAGNDRRRPEPAVRHKNTVLVIDDDATVHDLIKRFLGKYDFSVESAFNGGEGLRLAQKLRPDIITLDAVMPGINGWEVLSSLKANPDLQEIPVIMITMLDDRNRAYLLGAAEYLIKPIDRELLLNTLLKYQSSAENDDIVE